MERLSDKAIRDAVHDGECSLDEGKVMAREIQERRAADLTAGEIETVREMLLEFEANDSAWEDGTEDVQAVCRKILGAHGAKP